MGESKKSNQTKPSAGSDQAGPSASRTTSVVTLRHGREVNFGDFRRQMSIVGTQKFGRLAMLV